MLMHRRRIAAAATFTLLPVAAVLITGQKDATADSLGDPVIAAAGDIACAPGYTVTSANCHHGATANLLAGADKVLTLGDNQYLSGALSAFLASYDPTWGVYKSITAPVPGNHEYKTSGAQGYFDYFGAAAHRESNGYYSYDVGAWHLVALNSGSTAVPMTAKSAQVAWLKQDLAASPAACTLAYWHHPRFAAADYYPGFATKTKAVWAALEADHADVVLNGHDHSYQRYAPQTSAGQASVTGIRQFVVGTGGKSLDPLTTAPPTLEFERATYGVLRLTLRATSYEWQFVAEDGSVLDAGTSPCV